jgi:hypothetical protein
MSTQTKTTKAAAAKPKENKVEAKPEVKAEPETKQVKQEVKAPKEKPNKATADANLEFNVNFCKSWIRELFRSKDLEELPKFSGAQFALTAANQVLCRAIVQATLDQLQKDVSGLYDLKRPVIGYAIQLNEDLAQCCGKHYKKFDPSLNYASQYFIGQTEVTSYIDKFNEKTNVRLDNKAYNLLAYLLLRTSIELIETSHTLMLYAGKKSLDAKSVLAAIKTHVSGTLRHDMTMKIEDCIKALGDAVEEEDEAEAAPAQEVTETKKAVPKKAAAKKAAQVDEEEAAAEDGEEAEAEPEEAEAEAEAEAEEVAPEPTTASKKTTTVKAKPAAQTKAPAKSATKAK